jgi:hypothetical protein
MDLAPILRRITDASGDFLPLQGPDRAEREKLIERFQEQTSNHYQEIIENCEVNFTKEIEFETFRKNFTYEEAEEIRAEYEKISAWYERVLGRDWFGAPNKAEAKEWLNRCEKMLEDFEAKVYERQEKASIERGSLRTTDASGAAPWLCYPWSNLRRPATSSQRGPRSRCAAIC